MNIFIVGCARSGSTLLKSMLNAHSKIHFPTELFFFNSIRPTIVKKFGSMLSSEHTPEVIATLTRCWWLRDARIDFDRLEKQILSLPDPYEPDLLYMALLNTFRLSGGVPIVGEKTISNIRHTGLIAKLLHPCRFIYLERDPRAILSSRKSSGVGKANAKSVVDEWVFAAKLYTESYQYGNWHKVQYEQLVLDTEIEMVKICNFLGVEFEQEMLKYFSRKERGYDKAQSHHSATLKPVFSDNLNAWQTSLSPTMISYINYHLHGLMLGSGYQADDELIAPNFLTRVRVNSSYHSRHITGKMNQLRRRLSL